MHFSEISFSKNLEILKFKNFPFWANCVDAYRGITKQISKNWQLCYVIIKLSESKTTKGAFTYYIITEGGGGL